MLRTRSEFFKTLFVTVLFLLGVALQSADAFADSGYGKQKVVYHVNYDDPKKQAGALRNIQNHINAVGKDNLDIKVVLHGNGLAMLLEPDSLEKLTKFKHANADETMTAKIDGLKNQGVSFQVCDNTVRGRKVDVQTDLYNVSQDDIVPSGVAEVAALQQKGYVYIKP
ncbi:MAG: DsrE family protein [Gammaproteobacteria bacterium]|nr:DsrE family protein [Gammaproteobacteria bacterium]